MLKEGDWITIDGTTGNVIVGKLDLIPPPSELPDWLAEFLGWADEIERLQVWANADTPDDARKARDLGATGIGLCRTEHMFMQTDRLPIVQRMIISDTPEARAEALAQLLPFQRDDFAGILEAMAGYPVTIRLLDPPLHEFLPSLEQLLVETTELRVTKGEAIADYHEKMKMLARVRALHEAEPDARPARLPAGHRLSRDLRDAGARDLRGRLRAAQARRRRAARRDDPRRRHARGDADHLRRGQGGRRRGDRRARRRRPYRIGTMVELPRACVVADDLAEIARVLFASAPTISPRPSTATAATTPRRASSRATSS